MSQNLKQESHFNSEVSQTLGLVGSLFKAVGEELVKEAANANDKTNGRS